MAPPITWQNINAPSLGDPGRSLQLAGASFNDAFGALRQELAAYRTTQDQNWEAGKTLNTDRFLSALASRYTTPEALAAAQKSGELEQFRQSFGAQVDQRATREALDSRLGILQQRGINAMQYQNQAEEQALRPLYQQGLALAKSGDRKALSAFIAANPGLAARYQGDLVGQGVDSEQKLRTFEEHLLTAASQRNTAAGNLEVARGQLRVSERNANTNAAQLGLSQRRQAFDMDLASEQRVADLTQKLGLLNASAVSPEGVKLVTEGIEKAFPAGADRNAAMKAYQRLAANPKYRDAPPAAMLQVLLGDASEQWGIFKDIFGTSTGDNAEAKLDSLIKNTNFRDLRALRETQTSVLLDQINRLEAGRAQALGLPPPSPRALPALSTGPAGAPGAPAVAPPVPAAPVAPDAPANGLRLGGYTPPADSPAGKALAARTAARLERAQKEASERQAKEAEGLAALKALPPGDVRAAVKLQKSDLFKYLPAEEQMRVFLQVNGKTPSPK